MRGRFVCVGLVAILLATALVGGCKPGGPNVDEEVAQTAPEGLTDSQKAELKGTESSAPASGPSVDKLITIADIKGILGRDDIVFAVAT